MTDPDVTRSAPATSTPMVHVYGAGAVGWCVAEELANGSHDCNVVVIGRNPTPPRTLSRWRRSVEITTTPHLRAGDVVVLALPRAIVVDATATALAAGCDVVDVSDDPQVVRTQLARSSALERTGQHLVVGAGYAPGYTALLARYAALHLTQIDEVHTSTFGTAGPACARQHHWALHNPGLEYRAGHWLRRAGGTGRELCWFPEPVGSADCYRAALADPIVLARLFPEARRIRSTMAATRRDRMTSRLPMLRSPHPEGLLGGVRVEVRGRIGASFTTRVVGACRRPAAATASVAALAVQSLLEQRIGTGGAFGLADRIDLSWALTTLRERGLRPQLFEGTQ